MKNKFLSILLIISILLSIFNVFVFANELTYIEGLIISNENELQILSLDGKFYDVSPDMEKDVDFFCNIIANSGVKLTLTVSDDKENNSLKILGIYTSKELPEKIQKQWVAYQKELYGIFTELEGVITKTDDVFSFVTTDTIYTPMKFEYVYVGAFADILANTGTKVKIESALFNDNSIVVSYMETTGPTPDKYVEQLEEYIKTEEAKDAKKGVIVSHGLDAYMLVEKDTNKMYYITTDNEYIFMIVPILADLGYEVSINGVQKAENHLHLYALEIIDTLPDSVTKEIQEADKQRFESTYFNIEGHITFDNEKDYNIHFADGEVLGLETRIEDVAKVIKAVANDETVKLKLEGYINYDETVMDVRKITFLVDINEGETLKKLQEAFPPKEENKTTEQNFLNGSSTTNSNTTNNSFNNAYNDIYSDIFGTTGNSSNDISSLFANFFANSSLNEVYSQQTNQNPSFNNFSSIFGSDVNEFFASFNAFSQNQSSMLNSGNLQNFNFEDFQTAFDSMSNNANSLQPESNTSTNTSNTTEN